MGNKPKNAKQILAFIGSMIDLNRETVDRYPHLAEYAKAKICALESVRKYALGELDRQIDADPPRVATRSPSAHP